MGSGTSQVTRAGDRRVYAPWVSESRPSAAKAPTESLEAPGEAQSPSALAVLYAEVDERAAQLARVHGPRLHCQRGCAGCCRDGLEVFEIEAAHIRAYHSELLASGTPAPPGPGPTGADRPKPAEIGVRPQLNVRGDPDGVFGGGRCAFLDAEDACRIYPHRPYVCRSQGLPLRWLDHDEEQELRDICPLNAGPDGVDLISQPADACFELGPFEGRLAMLQAVHQRAKPGTPLKRVALRNLFAA